MRLFTKELSSFVSPSSYFQGSTKSLVLPLDLTISNVCLSGEVSVVMSKTKGATVVFQGSPLRSVEIQSSLDFLPGASDMIKQEINDELVLMFSDYIPDMIYKLSLENNTEASAYERNLANLMIASKDRQDRTVLFSRDRRFPFISDALLNSENLKSVSAIRNSTQTLSLAEPFADKLFDCDIVHSPACLSTISSKAQLGDEKQRTFANNNSNSNNEDSKSNATPPRQASASQQQPVRKQRRVISLRKNFNTTSNYKNNLPPSETFVTQPPKPRSLSTCSRRSSSTQTHQATSFSHPSSPMTKSVSINNTNLHTEPASAPASILSSPRPAPRNHRRRSPDTLDSQYFYQRPHDITAIPFLDFKEDAPVTPNWKNKQTTKHNDYLYHLKREPPSPNLQQPTQQHSLADDDNLTYYKTRTKANVATPKQIFFQSSSTTAEPATNVGNQVVIVGDDHTSKTGEPFYRVGSVSFNIPPPIYR